MGLSNTELPVSGGWWAALGGAVTGLVIGTVPRMYPGIGLVSLLGIGIVCGALFNVVMFFATKKLRRS